LTKIVTTPLSSLGIGLGSYGKNNLPHAKGRLTKVSSSVSTTEYTAFDILGRVLAAKQTTEGGDAAGYSTGYTYNLSGALIEETYPSGRKVKNVLDDSGDLSIVQSKKNTGDFYRPYASNFTYNAAGAVTEMKLGNGRWESTQFNSRLQPIMIGLGSGPTSQNLLKLEYGYGTSDNNGNVISQTITVNRTGQTPLVFEQAYTYDSLNRITSATEMTDQTQNWKQAYTFDRYGNRNFDETQTTTIPKNCGTSPNFVVCASDIPIVNPSVNANNNRLNGTTYDTAGNVISDAEGRTFTYDGENKQTEVRNSGSSTIGQYYFDGDGKRVKKYVPNTGETTIFVYDAGGKLVAEYSTNISATPWVQYQTLDSLGTPRINTDQLGAVISRTDYMPYGEEIIGLGNRTANDKYVADDVRQGFTGYINDEETGLDFAKARMYSKNHGRFWSADPLLSTGTPNASQSWNRFSYVLNSPLRYRDKTGLYVCKGSKEQCEQFAAKLAASKADLSKIENTYGGESSKEYKKAAASLNSYGEDETGKKKNNGVIVTFDLQESGGKTFANFDKKTGKLQGNITVSFNSQDFSSDSGQSLVAHEGSHVNDKQTVGMRDEYDAEMDAYTVQSLFVEAQFPNERKVLRTTTTSPSGREIHTEYDIWNPSWKEADKQTLRSNAIKEYLAVPKDQGGL